MIELRGAGYHLALTPDRGGSIAQFDWRGIPLMRASCGPSILQTACFPLVPFSNRIAFGRFETNAGPVRLSPNFPGSEHPHPLHGFGWLTPWRAVTASQELAVLRHEYKGGEWPWRYESEQRFELGPQGLVHELSLVNLSDGPMPAGLGMHPYFPCTGRTLLSAMHRGEWQTTNDGLPMCLKLEDHAIDWWHDQPVSTRSVDTVYMGREGPMTIIWPERATRLEIIASDELDHTVIFTPPSESFFCVEPVSHSTDAINGGENAAGLRWLASGEEMRVSVRYGATSLDRRGSDR